MDEHTIRIDNTRVQLHEILDCLTDASEIKWSVLFIEAIGQLENTTMVEFEEQVRNSQNGVQLSLESLLNLSSNLTQIIDLILVGDKNIINLKKYRNDEEMYAQCMHVVQMLDSSYWQVNSKSTVSIDRLRSRFVT